MVIMVHTIASQHHQLYSSAKRGAERNFMTCSVVLKSLHTDKYGQVLTTERTGCFRTLLPVKLHGIIPQKHIAKSLSYKYILK